MTRHGITIHVAPSAKSRPTGGPAPIRMARAVNRANTRVITGKRPAIRPQIINSGALKPINTAATADPPEASIYKTP